MRYMILLLFLSMAAFQWVFAENLPSLNLQYHYDIRREFPTVTQEFYAGDPLGYTFFFMDINFDHNVKKGGASDFYFEFMRYFTIAHWKRYDFYVTLQYDDGSEPVKQIWLGGLNMGNIRIGPLNLSTEFLLKRDYRLNLTWQYTIVWTAEFLKGRIFFVGYMDYWKNDVDNPNWPVFSDELKKSRYSFMSEPQIGWKFTSHWKAGSEIEIGRGFVGSVTGKLFLQEKYVHDKWYVLPTVFVEYTF